MGFPGIQLDVRGAEVKGFLFISENLSNHWSALDEFEGEAYERVLTNVTFEDVGMVDAFIYALKAG